MITERKTMRKKASSAVDGGGKIIDAQVEVVKTTDSVDHWDFLDQIEAPMWADLSICDFTNDDSNDSWFDIIHQFHECSSSQLLSTIFHPNSITIKESPPPSPKLPPSVSKSRGKNYKTKSWGQRNNPTTSINQHPLKTLTMNPSRITRTSHITKPSSIQAPKASSSCESGLTNTSRPKLSKSSLCSVSSQEQEQKSSGHSAMSTLTSNHNEQEKKNMELTSQTSNKTSDLLSSLRNNLRRSCATRPAVRMVRCSEGEGFKFKTSSRKSSVASSSLSLDQCKNNILGDAHNNQRTKLKVSNVTKVAPAQNVKNILTSKVQQNTSFGKVLMPRKINEQNQMIDKEDKKVASTKIGNCQKGSDKEGQSTRNVQKNGSKKLISIKEKTNTQKRDKDASRKVYFR